jgi:hypothetical protein
MHARSSLAARNFAPSTRSTRSEINLRLLKIEGSACCTQSLALGKTSVIPNLQEIAINFFPAVCYV